jgi:chitodextrinase
MGAQVINCSFMTVKQPDLEAAVDAAVRAGITIVTAAGNFGVTHYLAYREDVVSVAATDADDRVTSWSTSGPHIDLAAPGSRIASTTVNRDDLGHRYPDYTKASGTSFASPLVAGAVALMQSHRRALGLAPLSPAEALMRLFDTADDIGAINPTNAGYGSGRLNLLRALTDPPSSRVAATRRRIAGPGVVLPGGIGSPSTVVVPTAGGTLVGFDGLTGAIEAEVSLRASPAGGVTAAHMGPGTDGIGLFVATQDGRVHGFDAGLAPLGGWPVLAPVGGVTAREPVLGDWDGDGVLEVFWSGGHDGKLWAWEFSGAPLVGFPRTVAPPGTDVAIAVAPIDDTEGVEIVAAGGGWVHVIGRIGELPGWPVQAPAASLAPLITRWDRAPVVICASKSGVEARRANGNLLWKRGDVLFENPVAGDLNGDGTDELVLLRSNIGLMTVVDSAGRDLPAWAASPVLTGSILGEPLIGPVGPHGERGFLLSLSNRGIVAFDEGGLPLRNFPKPGGVAIANLIADLDGDGRADVVAGAPAEPTIDFDVCGASDHRTPVSGWVTHRANFARTGSRCDVPPMELSVPGEAPARIGDLAVAGVPPGAVELEWTAPATESGASSDRNDVRYSLAPITPENLIFAPRAHDLPAPLPAGSHEGVRISGLDEEAIYYFTARALANGRWSPMSNLASATTPPFPPAPISDLRVIASAETGATLRWTGTGDDGLLGRPSFYEIRAAPAPFDSASFDQAPLVWRFDATVDAGGTETRMLTGLEAEREYWIAIVAVDDRGHRSPTSPILRIRIQTVAPDAILDLTVLGRTDRSVTLRWTATGDDGRQGEPLLYRLAAAPAPITTANFDGAERLADFPATVPAGEPENATLFGLQPSRHYWIAVIAIDHAGNRSVVEGNVEATTIDTLVDIIDDLRISSRSDTAVVLSWTAMNGVSSPRPRGYRVSVAPWAMDESNFQYAPTSFEVGSRVDAGGTETTSAVDLTPFLHYWFAVCAVDRSGTLSRLSNMVEATMIQVPPSPIIRFTNTAHTDTTLSFQWTATGDDGRVGRCARNLLRAADQPLTDSTFDQAPLAWEFPGRLLYPSLENATVAGFEKNHAYFFAVAAVDRNGNRSHVSQNVELTTVQTAPYAPSAVHVTATGDNSVTMQWRASGEDGNLGTPSVYSVHAAYAPITADDFDHAPLAWEIPALHAGGGVETATIWGLLRERRYWIAMVALDRNGNRSTMSNVVEVAMPAIPPSAVADLTVDRGDGDRVLVKWTATGEDGVLGRPDRYLVRAAEVPIDAATFDSAPLRFEVPATVDAGDREAVLLSGFDPRRVYWFAIAAVDHAGNRSPISNVADIPTPVLAPSPIRDLAIAARGAASVTLRWNAVDPTRPVISYRVRASERPIDESSFDAATHGWETAPRAGGREPETIELTGLERERRWWVAVAAVGEAGRSAISNVVETWIGRLAGGVGAALVAEARPARAPVRLLWRTRAASGGERAIRVYDVRGRLQARLELSPGLEGASAWDGRDLAGRPAPAGIYFARMVDGRALVERLVLLR